ncbi:iron-only hydrogenase system regulator [Desulfovibrio sp. OttesenSCG-928-C06]|nr:iron-only hydrogenase system regulator [Desulfovibrio sp. OttesenSCG-928-C06]
MSQDTHEQETRVAIIGIIVEHEADIRRLNDLLSQYGDYIIGRMGLPYRKRRINIISVVLDAPQDIISALSGKLGMLPHVSSKTIYSKSGAPEA